jgi:hypothetical protein
MNTLQAAIRCKPALGNSNIQRRVISTQDPRSSLLHFGEPSIEKSNREDTDILTIFSHVRRIRDHNYLPRRWL